MNIGIGNKIYHLISTLEAKHKLLWADGLHRQILMAVVDAHRTGLRMTNQKIADLGLTSRSSTYRKISDLKQSGFLSDIWDDNVCYLSLGPSAIAMLADADNKLKAMSEKAD